MHTLSLEVPVIFLRKQTVAEDMKHQNSARFCLSEQTCWNETTSYQWFLVDVWVKLNQKQYEHDVLTVCWSAAFKCVNTKPKQKDIISYPGDANTCCTSVCKGWWNHFWAIWSFLKKIYILNSVTAQLVGEWKLWRKPLLSKNKEECQRFTKHKQETFGRKWPHSESPSELSESCLAFRTEWI